MLTTHNDYLMTFTNHWGLTSNSHWLLTDLDYWLNTDYKPTLTIERFSFILLFSLTTFCYVLKTRNEHKEIPTTEITQHENIISKTILLIIPLAYHPGNIEGVCTCYESYKWCEENATFHRGVCSPYLYVRIIKLKGFLFSMRKWFSRTN